ncbi:hypothetical protein KC887_05405 [Candidatus Kaiserbacteria bacterium]|nr:hypothetical protein [Candidatus Kaiserbacteria bacterium]
MQQNTAKNFVLQLGSLASLYLSLAFFLVLIFGLVNLMFPDTLDQYYNLESYASSVRLGFAMTIVFFPTYLYLTRLVNKNRRGSNDHAYLGLTKWLIYLSLLVAGAVLLSDLVAVIMGFLEGELTTRFLIKATAVLVVTGAAFYYYAKDAQGYWVKNEKQSITYGFVAGLIILGTLLASLAHIDTPAQVREIKADQQQVQDLQQLQYAIIDRLQVEGNLISSLDELYSGRPLPTPPEGRPAYTYATTTAGFELCATFSADAPAGTYTDMYTRPVSVIGLDSPTVVNADDWYYEAGDWCFERTVAKPAI